MGTTPKGCTLNLPCCLQEESGEQGVLNFGLENKPSDEYYLGEPYGSPASALGLSCSHKTDIWAMSALVLCITKASWRLLVWVVKAEHYKASCGSRAILASVVTCMSPGPGSGLTPSLPGSPAKCCPGEVVVTRDYQSDEHNNQSSLTRQHPAFGTQQCITQGQTDPLGHF